MAAIIQLSDLHLDLSREQHERLVEPMIASLAMLRERDGVRVDLLVITGDLFESADVDLRLAVDATKELLRRVREAIGYDVRAVILPGNHDRRVSGLIGPHRGALFDAMRSELDRNTLVMGCRTPFLAERIDDEFHGLPLTLASFDSTYLPSGLVSAGGVLRQDDLLQLADALDGEDRDRPLVILTHHHLVPTALTDMSRVDVNTKSKIARWLAKHVLAALVSNADHEEITMTALGAGTALSTLHSMQRAIVVLHGHKHYPTARALRGTQTDQGDLLLVAAGSSATVLSWNASEHPDVAQLWPSYNLITLQGASLSVDSVAFSPCDPEKKGEPVRVAVRPLVHASRDGNRWNLSSVVGRPENAGNRLLSNALRITLVANPLRGGSRSDLLCVHRVQAPKDTKLTEYVHFEEGDPGTKLIELKVGDVVIGEQELPARIAIPIDGTRVSWRIVGGACSTREEALRANEDGSPFESVELFNRYESEKTTLSIDAVPDGARAFGSATDLTTGHERMMPVTRDGAMTELTMSPCPPRTLLRIRWPLTRE